MMQLEAVILRAVMRGLARGPRNDSLPVCWFPSEGGR